MTSSRPPTLHTPFFNSCLCRTACGSHGFCASALKVNFKESNPFLPTSPSQPLILRCQGTRFVWNEGARSKGSHTAPRKAEFTQSCWETGTHCRARGGCSCGTALPAFKYSSFSLGNRKTSFHHTVPDFTAQDHVLAVQMNKRIQTHRKCCCQPCWPLHPLSPPKDQSSPPWGPEVPQ